MEDATISTPEEAVSDDNRPHGTDNSEHCFVVSPFKPQRATDVYETYIRPACQESGFKVHRADEQLTPEIMPTVTQTLRDSELVIAYLGEYPWNANVMVEVGFRLATRRPIVLLRERLRDDDPELPFDLKDYRVIDLPSPEQTRTTPNLIDETIKRIKDVIAARLKEPDIWTRPLATATVCFNIGEKGGFFTDASPAASKLFNVPSLRGMNLCDIIKNLSQRMTETQGLAFHDEQQRLFGQVAVPVASENKPPLARVPIVLTEKKSVEAFLPLIVRYSAQGAELLLDLLYLDVSAATKKNKEGIYSCKLQR